MYRRHPLPGTRLGKCSESQKPARALYSRGWRGKVRFCVEYCLLGTVHCTMYIKTQLGANISPPKRELLLSRRHFCSPMLCSALTQAIECNCFPMASSGLLLGRILTVVRVGTGIQNDYMAAPRLLALESAVRCPERGLTGGGTVA